MSIALMISEELEPVMFDRIALAFVLIFSASHAAHSQSLRIRMAVASAPDTSVWRGAQLYRDSINRQLDGLAQIDLLPSGSLKNPLTAVRSGEIEMAVVASSALAASGSQPLALLDLPFFFRDLREVSAIQDSLVGEVMLGSVNQERVLVGLAYWNYGMSHLFGPRPIQETSQFKGLKLRTTVSPLAQVAPQVLGVAVISVPTGEVITALSRGAIDLVEIPPAFVTQKVVPLEPTTHTNINYRPVVAVLVANTKFWRAARLRVQSVLVEEARAVTDQVNGNAQEGEKSAMDALNREFKAVTVSQSQFEAFSEAATPGWFKVQPLLASGFLDSAISTRNELRRVNYVVPKRRSDSAPNTAQRMTIAFATDRHDDVAQESDPALRFSAARGSLSFGNANVVLDPNRPFGTGDVSMVKLEAITRNSGAAAFAGAIKDQLERSARREILVYVHGFRTKFKDAIESAAQIATDVRFQGVTMVFSWPSDGTVSGYPSDEEDVNDSRDNFVSTLKTLGAVASAEKLHIITHSMGGRLAADGMEWLSTQPADSRPKLYHLILAAPDVRVNHFTRTLPGMRGQSKRMTLYASEWDQALRCSRSYHGSHTRAGQGGTDTRPFEDVEVIDVSAVEAPSWFRFDRRLLCTPNGHSYMSQNHVVLADLYTLLTNDTLPKDRQRLHEKKQGKLFYWELK